MISECSWLCRDSLPPNRALEMVVVIPACDEARHLTTSLRALASQLDMDGLHFLHGQVSGRNLS